MKMIKAITAKDLIQMSLEMCAETGIISASRNHQAETVTIGYHKTHPQSNCVNKNRTFLVKQNGASINIFIGNDYDICRNTIIIHHQPNWITFNTPQTLNLKNPPYTPNMFTTEVTQRMPNSKSQTQTNSTTL